MATSAAVTELKAHLSEYLRTVKRGEEVLVTERGKPIARLMPLPPASESDGLDELERAGLFRRGEGPLPDDFDDLPRMKDPDGLLLKALLDEREHGR